ncbi:MAG: hypothetical protein AB7N76_27845 [Planctomycetota bacterium]
MRGPRHATRATPPLLALLLALSALPGCVGAPPAEPTQARSPAGPVVLVHGIFPDSVSWWIDEVQAELHRRGVQTLPVGYESFVFGYLTGLGTDGPADRIAALEQGLRLRHARAACRARLQLAGVGFSAGTAVLEKAAERGVRFQRLYFAGSPLPLWSGALEEQLREDRVGVLVNYYSPLDGVVNGLLGMGAFGFRGAGPAAARVENRLHWRPHWLPLWDDEDEVHAVCAELVRAAGEGPPHTCFEDPAFAAWFREAKARLRAGEPPPGAEWRAPRVVVRRGAAEGRQ